MIYFKGSSSDSKKLIISSTPVMPKALRRIETISIPGRNGFLTIDEGVYDSILVSVECHFGPNASRDEIVAWLDGSGKFSLDNVREYDAVVKNSITLKKVIDSYRSFVVQFECQPIGIDKTVNTFTVDTNPKTLTITGATASMDPTIEITGSGDVTVTINNKTFNLYSLTEKLILDCKNKVVTNVAGANNSLKMLYEFPVLSPGANVISTTGTITEFLIKYQKSYL